MSFRKWVSLSLLATMGLTQAVNAAGFATRLSSVTGLGVADAGGAAIANDASSIFWNPAGMTRLCGTEGDASAFILFPSAKFHNRDSINVLGQELTGGNGKNAGENALAGSFFLTKEMDYGFWFGFGVNSPFGLVTDYGHEWVGRYHAIRSQLLTININPSLAYRINDCWSVGVGFSALYAHIKFTNAVDFGLLGFLANPNLGLLPEQNDGQVILRANGWGYGGNAGILYEMNECTRFGAQYRSQVYLDVSGDEEFSDVPSIFTPVFTDARLHAKTRLPATASFSGYHQLNDSWAVMGDITWTGWHSLNKLVIKFNTTQPDGITTFNWKDSWRYAVGTTYDTNCSWIFRGGFAYDQRVNDKKELTSARVPENDKFIFAIGAGYNMSGCLKLDFGYMYEIYKDPKVDKADFAEAEDIPRGGLRGHWDVHVHIIAAQASYHF